MFPLRRLSISRALLVAMAVLLAFAILAVTVHPDYDVSKATVADQLTALLLAVVQVLGSVMACVLVVLYPLTAVVSQPQALLISVRSRVRRI